MVTNVCCTVGGSGWPLSSLPVSDGLHHVHRVAIGVVHDRRLRQRQPALRIADVDA